MQRLGQKNDLMERNYRPRTIADRHLTLSKPCRRISATTAPAPTVRQTPHTTKSAKSRAKYGERNSQALSSLPLCHNQATIGAAPHIGKIRYPCHRGNHAT